MAWDKDREVYVVGFAKKNKRNYIGSVETVEEGFKLYKTGKMKYLYELLEGEYKFIDENIKDMVVKCLERKFNKYS